MLLYFSIYSREIGGFFVKNYIRRVVWVEVRIEGLGYSEFNLKFNFGLKSVYFGGDVGVVIRIGFFVLFYDKEF